jgi:hypothetical protein
MEEENSEGSLILLVNSPDFDSAIRRFDPSRLSQPVTRPEIVVNFRAKPLQFAGASRMSRLSLSSENRQLWRESSESLQPQPRKFPFLGDFQRRQISMPLSGRVSRLLLCMSGAHAARWQSCDHCRECGSADHIHALHLDGSGRFAGT